MARASAASASRVSIAGLERALDRDEAAAPRAGRRAKAASTSSASASVVPTTTSSFEEK